MNPSFPVKLKSVGFSYGAETIFSDFDLEITDDQFIGIVGTNGSGKSTLLKLILGLLSPTKGHIEVMNLKAGDFKSKFFVGSSLQDIDFPSTEKVEEILTYVSQQFADSNDIEQLIKDFSLEEFRHKACGQLSGGMKRRVSLACAFLGKPRIVLLDEPTTGLDQASRKQLMSNLRQYQKDNQALIMMISHHPGEISEYVDQFFHIKDSAVENISPEKMAELASMRKVVFNSHKNLEAPGALRIKKQGTCYSVIVKDSDQFMRDLCAMEFPFEDLQIHTLGADELIGEIL